ncbi:hypothetical protein MKQ70_07095 [Chitinophaga sedimenti]|uniref:hypothetical protein n=1 Tax=Chitinophaga sedimenti TaxID=2033606 RepID=UPI002005166C|nr:hypothetical protein [Chitinophaga sedimenti]MCK7554779.1 hypothetical protein [Chitinophaga sedimenti]
MMAALATIAILWSSAAVAQFTGLNQVTYNEPQTSANLTVNIAPTGSFATSDPNTSNRHFLVQMMGGYNASQDVLDITNQGSGPGQIGVSGNTVYYGGTAFASFSNSGGYMDFSLNAAATPASISALLRAITYTNTSQEPTVIDRTMWVFYISTGNPVDQSASFIIKVNAGNDAPTIDPYGPIAVTEDAAYTLTGVSATDPEEGASNVTLRFTATQGIFTATAGERYCKR